MAILRKKPPKKNASETESAEPQQRLHGAASKCLGAFAGGDSHRSENVRRAVRDRLRCRHAR